MATKKKTPEELQIAAHNRLKGTICFHVSSTISQANCVLDVLGRFKDSSFLSVDHETSIELQRAMINIRNALIKYQGTVYTKLDIGNSPTSHKKQSPLYKKPPYGTRK